MTASKKGSVGRLGPAALAVLSILVAGCASAPAPIPPAGPPSSLGAAAERVSAFIPGEMKARGIAGLAIAVSDEEATLWSAGFGLADRSTGRKFDAATISNIGSISKIFTATAIMKLAQEGKLDLDAPVSTYLPDFAPRPGPADPALPGKFDATGVTIRGLLTHHSGLQGDYLANFMGGAKKPEGYPRPYAANAVLASQTRLCAPPGQIMAYSNLGYSLLGLVVERVSGSDFAAYVSEEILKPLGMTSSSFLIEERFSDRYARTPAGSPVAEIPYIRDMPAGSLNASAEDMGRFMTAVLASVSDPGPGPRTVPQLLSSDTQKSMWVRQNASSDLDFDFSIGLGYWLVDIGNLPGTTLVGHGGDLISYHAILLFDPARRLGVFAMVNSENGLGSFSLATIVEVALRSFGGALGREAYAPPRPEPKPAAFPPGLAARISGDYASPNGLARVRPKGEGISVLAFGNRLEGFYRDDGSIGLRARLLGIELPIPVLKEIYLTTENLEGETLLAMRSNGILMGDARKVSASPLPEAWKARLGTWAPVKKEPMPYVDSASLAVDGESGLLLLTLGMMGQKQAFPVRAVSDDRLVVLGSGRDLGVSIEVASSGREELLDVYGVEMRRK